MNRRIYMLALLLFCIASIGFSQQRFYTKTGKITFQSKAPLEDIEAVNKTAGAVLDAATGQLQFVVLMRGFEFKKALMQEHFNENYVESHTYPKAEFKGSITNNKDVAYNKSGTYNVEVKGQLSIHGITREITVPASLTANGEKIDGEARFAIQLSDYRIAIPSLMKDKISNRVSVTVAVKLEPLKK